MVTYTTWSHRPTCLPPILESHDVSRKFCRPATRCPARNSPAATGVDEASSAAVAKTGSDLDDVEEGVADSSLDVGSGRGDRVGVIAEGMLGRRIAKIDRIIRRRSSSNTPRPPCFFVGTGLESNGDSGIWLHSVRIGIGLGPCGHLKAISSDQLGTEHHNIPRCCLCSPSTSPRPARYQWSGINLSLLFSLLFGPSSHAPGAVGQPCTLPSRRASHCTAAAGLSSALAR